MICKNCGVTVRPIVSDPGVFTHVVEVPGTSRTSASYLFCRLSVAEPDSDE